MKRILQITVALLVVISLVFLGTKFIQYLLTDYAYEKLSALEPRTRIEVESSLREFHALIIDDQDRMVSSIKKLFSSKRNYIRYVGYSGLGIDVIYDERDQVLAIWPEYE